ALSRPGMSDWMPHRRDRALRPRTDRHQRGYLYWLRGLCDAMSLQRNFDGATQAARKTEDWSASRHSEMAQPRHAGYSSAGYGDIRSARREVQPVRQYSIESERVKNICLLLSGELSHRRARQGEST